MTLRRLNHLQFRGCLARVVFADQVPVEQKETAIIFSFSLIFSMEQIQKFQIHKLNLLLKLDSTWQKKSRPLSILTNSSVIIFFFFEESKNIIKNIEVQLGTRYIYPSEDQRKILKFKKFIFFITSFLSVTILKGNFYFYLLVVSKVLKKY